MTKVNAPDISNTDQHSVTTAARAAARRQGTAEKRTEQKEDVWN